MNTRILLIISFIALNIQLHAQNNTNDPSIIKHGPMSILPYEDFETTIGKDIAYVRVKQEWFRIYIGYSYNSEPPPGKAFILDDLPADLKNNAQIIEIKTLANKKHHHADYFVVDHDPLFRPLKNPFPLGEIAYTRVKRHDPGAITLAYYYYDSGEINWKTSNSPEPSEHILDRLEIKGEIALPPDKWYIQVTNTKAEEHISDNKITTRKLYRYVFIRVTPM